MAIVSSPKHGKLLQLDAAIGISLQQSADRFANHTRSLGYFRPHQEAVREVPGQLQIVRSLSNTLSFLTY